MRIVLSEACQSLLNSLTDRPIKKPNLRKASKPDYSPEPIRYDVVKSCVVDVKQQKLVVPKSDALRYNADCLDEKSFLRFSTENQVTTDNMFYSNFTQRKAKLKNIITKKSYFRLLHQLETKTSETKEMRSTQLRQTIDSRIVKNFKRDVGRAVSLESNGFISLVERNDLLSVPLVTKLASKNGDNVHQLEKVYKLHEIKRKKDEFMKRHIESVLCKKKQKTGKDKDNHEIERILQDHSRIVSKYQKSVDYKDNYRQIHKMRQREWDKIKIVD